ncbi:hypothetical protein B5M09_012663 [Aphanomyces astaci]|uniref:Uncharacterized protein n=1 Tax=Aphanomyces astaci TaxID=112090 RepID=A0A3R7YDD1_APHAT|nr:hypothetical protein B5M09_012663 [Aphanomyces astaci]
MRKNAYSFKTEMTDKTRTTIEAPAPGADVSEPVAEVAVRKSSRSREIAAKKLSAATDTSAATCAATLFSLPSFCSAMQNTSP